MQTAPSNTPEPFERNPLTSYLCVFLIWKIFSMPLLHHYHFQFVPTIDRWCFFIPISLRLSFVIVSLFTLDGFSLGGFDLRFLICLPAFLSFLMLTTVSLEELEIHYRWFYGYLEQTFDFYYGLVVEWKVCLVHVCLPLEVWFLFQFWDLVDESIVVKRGPFKWY